MTPALIRNARPPGRANVATDEENNVARILAHLADAHGVEPVSSVPHPHPSSPPHCGEAPHNKGRDTHFQTIRHPSCGRKARERRREVMADLDSFEPPAERLRRCER